MLQKNSGILLHHFRYSDSALILKVFTEEEGTQSFFLRSSRKNKHQGILQPLNLLHLVSWKEEKKEMHTVKELNVEHPYSRIGVDFLRNTVVLFLNEIFYKSLRTGSPQPELFHFIREWLIQYDSNDFEPDAHLFLLAHMTSYLGFLPSDNYSQSTSWFDLREGVFKANSGNHSYEVPPEDAAMFYSLFREEMQTTIPSAKRKIMLSHLIEYYSHHVPDFGQLKSLPVITEVLKEI